MTLFDTREEAEDLIVVCSVCGKYRLFSIVTVPDENSGCKYALERCERKDCEEHCACSIPSLTETHDHQNLQSSVSMYI